MIEWLKTILGDAYTEDIDKKVAAEIGKAFVARADYNSLNESKKTLDATLKERDAQLEELKKIDAEGLQAKIAELQTANEKAKTDYEKALAETKFSSALELALSTSGAKSAKALRGFLDMVKIKLDGDKLLGLDEQIEAVRKEHDYLFGAEPDATGMKQGGAPGKLSGVEEAFYAKNPDLKPE